MTSDRPGGGLWLALVHHPVVDRQGRTVTTSVTNLDVHDLARSCRTYGLDGLSIVTPIDAQRAIVQRIVSYWNEPHHAARTPGRPESLALVHAVADLEQARSLASGGDGEDPAIIGTTARSREGQLPFSVLSREISSRPHRSRLLLMGTGWGLAEEVLKGCDHVLEPIRGPTDYNHLSVRSACAVLLDRLLGARSA